jgi:hypothetical protein
LARRKQTAGRYPARSPPTGSCDTDLPIATRLPVKSGGERRRAQGWIAQKGGQHRVLAGRSVDGRDRRSACALPVGFSGASSPTPFWTCRAVHSGRWPERKGLIVTEQDYSAVHIPKDPRFCLVEQLGDLEDEGALSEAIPFAKRFPKKLVVDLAPDGGDMITDFVNNIFRILIASRKAREILEAEGIIGDQVEYLPLTLRDRRRKQIKEPFFIVNTLRTVDCFDWKRSVYKTYTTNPREISPASLRVLHVTPDTIPEDAKLFRMGELREEIIVRADLVDRLKREGCEGLAVAAMGQRRI